MAGTSASLKLKAGTTREAESSKTKDKTAGMGDRKVKGMAYGMKKLFIKEKKTKTMTKIPKTPNNSPQIKQTTGAGGERHQEMA